MATVTLTGQPKYHAGFEPMLPGVGYVPYGDLEAMERAVGEHTAAILIEPIQGEGGVVEPRRATLRVFESSPTGPAVIFCSMRSKRAQGVRVTSCC